MINNCAVILAAGEGKRMKSNSPKVLSEVLFKPMLGWVIDSVKDSGIENICVVSGFKHDEIENYLKQKYPICENALQLERKGTGHAVKMAKDFLSKHIGSDVLILNGDAPFISSQTINDSYNLHKTKNNAATVISALLEEPFGYGRIVRNNENGKITSIIEQKDANEKIKKIKEVNSGAYWFNIDSLISVLDSLSNDNVQCEYYLPDTLKLLLNDSKDVDAFLSDSPELVLGANDCRQLYDLNQIARKNILEKFMEQGIRIPCLDGVIIGPNVTINHGATILPGTILSGNTFIGNNCIVGPNSYIIDSRIGNNVKLNYINFNNVEMDDDDFIPPFTYMEKIKLDKIKRGN